MFRAALLAAALLAAPHAAFAAGGGEGGPTRSERSIEVLHLVTPVVENGRLQSYLFVSLRVNLADGVDVWRMREKGHFLRDALLKASHRDPPVKSITEVDKARAVALFAQSARQVLGANAVKSVEILGVTPLKGAKG